MIVAWRHYARPVKGVCAAHAFVEGGTISACSQIMADAILLGGPEEPGDQRCRACERAIARHGDNVPYRVINVDLDTHSAIQCVALKTGKSMREVADELINKALDTVSAPKAA